MNQDLDPNATTATLEAPEAPEAPDAVEAPPAPEAAEPSPSAGEPVIVATQPPPPQPERLQRPRQARIIAFMNQKGGVGKTTTCVNLGAALSKLGFNVLLIDMDPQAHLSLHVGVDPDQAEGTMYDLLTEESVSALSIAYQANERLGVLPAEVNLAGVEAELAPQMVTGRAQNILKLKCEEFVSHFDYVLIDCPPSLGLLTINALTLAREVIVPMQAHFLALQGLSKLLETVRMVRQGINPKLIVSGVVLCMHESNTILAGEVVKDLKQFFEHGRGEDVPWKDAVLYQPPIRRNIKLAEAPSFGQPIFDYSPDCRGAEDYGRLAKCVALHKVAYA